MDQQDPGVWGSGPPGVRSLGSGPCSCTPISSPCSPSASGPGTRDPGTLGRCARILSCCRHGGAWAQHSSHPRRPVQRCSCSWLPSRVRVAPSPGKPRVTCVVCAQQVSWCICTSRRPVHPSVPGPLPALRGWRRHTVILGPHPCFVLPHDPDLLLRPSPGCLPVPLPLFSGKS